MRGQSVILLAKKQVLFLAKLDNEKSLFLIGGNHVENIYAKIIMPHQIIQKNLDFLENFINIKLNHQSV